MKEYTLLALLSASIVVWLDARLDTRLLRRGIFWIFLSVMFFFKTIMNGYLTWRPIVIYGDSYFLGIRLGTIPLEDYIYGFSLVTLTIVLWEFFLRKMKSQ